MLRRQSSQELTKVPSTLSFVCTTSLQKCRVSSQHIFSEVVYRAARSKAPVAQPGRNNAKSAALVTNRQRGEGRGFKSRPGLQLNSHSPVWSRSCSGQSHRKISGSMTPEGWVYDTLCLYRIFHVPFRNADVVPSCNCGTYATRRQSR
jgi:hypothetical protein